MVRFTRGARGGAPRGDRGGFGGGRGGFGGRPAFNQEPGNPTKIGTVMYPAEDNTLLCKSTIDRVPFFNKAATLESGGEIGKIDEILGPINDFYFSI